MYTYNLKCVYQLGPRGNDLSSIPDPYPGEPLNAYDVVARGYIVDEVAWIKLWEWSYTARVGFI